MVHQLIKDPIYMQLNHMLRDLIQSETYEPGDKFLSEREVAERYEVSRATANKALSSLVAEGVLAFKKGIGTFINESVLDYDLRVLVSFTNKAIAAGKTPSTTILQANLHHPDSLPPLVAQKLNIGNNESAYYLERLRCADSVPMILERRFVAKRYCPDLLQQRIQESLYALWTEKYKLEISGADQEVRAININKKEAALLEVEDGLAGFLIQSTGYIKGNKPLWWEETLYRGDAYAFCNKLGGIQAGSSPINGIFMNNNNL
jgi:GntR family transcriptional regulator